MDMGEGSAAPKANGGVEGATDNDGGTSGEKGGVEGPCASTEDGGAATGDGGVVASVAQQTLDAEANAVHQPVPVQLGVRSRLRQAKTSAARSRPERHALDIGAIIYMTSSSLVTAPVFIHQAGH